MNGWDLRADRRAAGLTAKQVAQAAGTSESNIAAYERGSKAPNHDTLERMAAALKAGSSSPVFVHNLLTVPAMAAVIRKGLREGWPQSDLLRVVREARSNARWLAGRADIALFLAKPSTTGDQRWDALIAGFAEDMALNLETTAPDWTVGHGLGSFWFVGSNDAFHAYALAHSPAAMKIRGVMIDPADLESV